jgi:Putative zinc-finger
MDHSEAVRQKATEKYLLNELDPEVRDQFEEHLFNCQDCALDVRAAAMFVEQTKVALAESPDSSEVRVPAAARPDRTERGWLAWFRPAFAVPVLALLLAVIGYQNLVTYPHLMQAANEPQVGPWASVNISTRGSEPTVVKVLPGQGFSLLMNLPPEDGFASYATDLYNPAGKLEWSGTISGPEISSSASGEGRQIHVPGGSRQAGTYTLVVRGITATGESKEVSRKPIDVQIQR